jgi:hypothetical protein
MSTVSPQLVLGLCILGACVATVVGYSLSRLHRIMVMESHASVLIDDWEKQNGAISRTFEGIAAGGLTLEQLPPDEVGSQGGKMGFSLAA